MRYGLRVYNGDEQIKVVAGYETLSSIKDFIKKKLNMPDQATHYNMVKYDINGEAIVKTVQIKKKK